MANELPSNVGYGTVTGRFLLAYSDSNDSDLYPDGMPAKGSVLFTPSPNYVKNVSASPAPVTILPATISCDLDSEGYILGYTGTRGVRLVATDDAQNNPVDWTWKVTFRLTDADGTPTRGIPDFSFELPQGTTVDLTTAMPVTDANGTYYLVGPTGPANELTVGTVEQLESTEGPTVEITGVSPDQVINFGIPKGAPNVLNIGTVTTGAAGSSASATVTGTTPTQTLNLTIPRGNTGATGPANTLTVGEVTTGAASSDAEVTITGTAPNQTIDFVIPQGIQGIQGDPNTLTVGTVTASAPGSDAEVTITGDSPNQTIDFVLPRGIQGPTGPIGPTGATGITWQGEWSNTTDYVNNDAVFYDGTSWFASGNPTVGEEPTLTATHWYPLAIQGATGPQGEVGPQGPQGEQGIPGNLGDLSGTLPITYVGSTIGFDPTYVSFIDGGTA
jgi:hypothetical protein